MTTAESPPHLIKAQADKIAAMLKRADEGRRFAPAAVTKETITIGIAMDDKFLKLEIPCSTIRENSETMLSAFIVAKMQEKP